MNDTITTDSKGLIHALVAMDPSQLREGCEECVRLSMHLVTANVYELLHFSFCCRALIKIEQVDVGA